MSKRLPEPTEGHYDKYYAGMLCRSAAWSVSAFADHLLIYRFLAGVSSIVVVGLCQIGTLGFTILLGKVI